MLWKNERESDNVVDQRSVGAKSFGVGGLLIGAVIYWFFGGNPLVFLMQNADTVRNSAPVASEPDHGRKKLVGVVLANTEDVWRAQFRARGQAYSDPKLVLFTSHVQSGCGFASEASGPFYCPSDHRVYLDLEFFDELSRSLGVRGEFAIAYVIAHEVGHHVQTLLGLDRNLRAGFSGGSDQNRASVQIELQADCLAGVWAKQTQITKNVIEPGDIDQAINAASAIGDDRLQKRAQGYVVPDSFTHGSSAQRTAAFKQGFAGGELRACRSSAESSL